MQFCGVRLRERREALSITRAQLAATVGVNVSTIQRAELGDFDPRAETIGRLAVALGLSVSDLFDEAPAA